MPTYTTPPVWYDSKGQKNKSLECIQYESSDYSNTAYGEGATAGDGDSGNGCIAIGHKSVANSSLSVAIGAEATTEDGGDTAIGGKATAVSNGIAIGKNTTVGSQGGIAIGGNNSSTTPPKYTNVLGMYGIALGAGAQVGLNSGIAVGPGAYADEKGIAIGMNASATGNQIQLGNPSTRYTLTIGNGKEINNDSLNTLNALTTGESDILIANHAYTYVNFYKIGSSTPIVGWYEMTPDNTPGTIVARNTNGDIYARNYNANGDIDITGTLKIGEKGFDISKIGNIAYIKVGEASTSVSKSYKKGALGETQGDNIRFGITNNGESRDGVYLIVFKIDLTQGESTYSREYTDFIGIKNNIVGKCIFDIIDPINNEFDIGSDAWGASWGKAIVTIFSPSDYPATGDSDTEAFLTWKRTGDFYDGINIYVSVYKISTL